MSDEELVDVVNESGTTLQVVPKSIAHQQGLLHKTVIAEVKDAQGRWLLIRQAHNKQDVGQWVSPMGGHVSAGESNEVALRRETEEELGITGDFRFELVGQVVYNRVVRERQENHLFVVYQIYSDAVPVLNEESTEFRYFTEEELRSELQKNPDSFGPPFRLIVEKFFPHLK